MEVPDSSAVLEEVEALFKKLQHLPENIRLKALSCIQDKLPEKKSSKDDEGAESQETVQSSEEVSQSSDNAQPTKPTTKSAKNIQSPRKVSAISKTVLPAKSRRSSVDLIEKQSDLKSSPSKAKHEKVELKALEDCSVKTQNLNQENETQAVSDKVETKLPVTVKPVFKIIPKRSIRISSVTSKTIKNSNTDEEITTHSQESQSEEVKVVDSKKKHVRKSSESADVWKENSSNEEDFPMEEKPVLDKDGNIVGCAKLDVVPSRDTFSPIKAKSMGKKSCAGPKSVKVSKKLIKVTKSDEDDSFEDDSTVLSKDSPSVSKDYRSMSFDDVGPVFVLEDVRTLSGRKTKRLNLASLSGFRKPRVKATTTKDTKNDSGSSVSQGKFRGPMQKLKAEVPSEVAESAEILASLSSGIPHKEGVDCLKDKTNNQVPVITYEFEAITEDENVLKEDEHSNPETKEQFVDLTESNSLTENDDSNIERDPLEDIEKNASGDYTCNFCDFKSATKVSLSAHVRKHKENIPKAEHVCPECNKKFSQSCSLQLHLKRHRGERDFHCSDCDYKAFTKVDLARHQTIHTGERNKICEYCGKTFAKDSTLRDHVKSVHERKVKHTCEMCGFVTHRANNLRVHIRMRHHGEYNNHVCPVCKASVKQKNAFLEHMRSHTGERPFKCECCTAAFACLARLNVHRNAVHGERLFKCEDCEKSFQTKHHLLRHRAIHTKERPYACPYCAYACNTQGNIAKHVRSIHNLPDFSYRRHKDLVENGGRPRDIDPEWIKKGEEVTEEYLNELSAKMGRTITVEELWSKQEELKKKREEQIKARQEAKERRALKNEAAGAAYLEKVRKRRLERQQMTDSGKKQKKKLHNESSGDTDPDADISEETEVPLYKLVSQGGNIRLCLETDELQVYTGDATREVPLLQMKDGDLNDSEEIQTIQGYMNDDGQFIRIEDGVMVDEDSSTVVVIIDSEMQDELNPDITDVMEVTCEEDFSNSDSEGLNLNVVSSAKGDCRSKPSVLRVIKQEME